MSTTQAGQFEATLMPSFIAIRWRIGALCVLLVDKTSITTKIFGCKQAALSGPKKLWAYASVTSIHGSADQSFGFVFAWTEKKTCWLSEKDAFSWCGLCIFQSLHNHGLKNNNLVTIS
jgi:hypothetical protein